MGLAVSHLFLALAAAGPSIQGSHAPPTLVFEFPDGARGGRGKIQGSGSMPDLGGRDFSLDQIRKCGAADARYSDVEVTHRQVIVAASTGRDREIIACVQRSVPSHFSVYVFAKDAPGTDVPFREFWSSPLTPADKVQ